MIISSIVSYVGRTIVKQLIDKLLAESKKLRSTNEELYELNEELEDRVQARTIDLEVAMEELRAAIEDLQNAQDRLMKTKSMESFLELARGLSHLINTPLGVSVTSVSYINNLIRDIKTSTEEKSISQKKLLENIAEVQGAINIISSNIDRSISVVAMLKRFSLYEPMREINLSDSLYVLQSEMKLDEFFKKANYDIRVDSEIQMKLPELTFHKIIRTIVENSIFFGQVEPLNVSIVIKEEPKHIRVELSDNGVGVSEEMREKIFEPFFSSNPHKLGMGLFIAESISHHMLNGRLYLDNEYRDGAKIVIMLPKEIDLLED